MNAARATRVLTVLLAGVLLVGGAVTPASAGQLPGRAHYGIAYVPLDRPGRITFEGRLRSGQAWSTSKVLVVAALLKAGAHGDPANLSVGERRLIRRALHASDMNALLAVRARVPGRAGAVATRILRSIGDRVTWVPDRAEGGMWWSLGRQVRFMAALAAGRVVNARTSRFLLSQMHPIRAHRWGLGRIGARVFKGGWLTAATETRQMGLVDGYAVAIITDAGPARLQSDGDWAHVAAVTAVARRLQTLLRGATRPGCPTASPRPPATGRSVRSGGWVETPEPDR